MRKKRTRFKIAHRHLALLDTISLRQEATLFPTFKGICDIDEVVESGLEIGPADAFKLLTRLVRSDAGPGIRPADIRRAIGLIYTKYKLDSIWTENLKY